MSSVTFSSIYPIYRKQLIVRIVIITCPGSAIQFELCTLYNEYNLYIAMNCDHHLLCNSVYIQHMYIHIHMMDWGHHLPLPSICAMSNVILCWIIVNIQFMYLCQCNIECYLYATPGYYTCALSCIWHITEMSNALHGYFPTQNSVVSIQQLLVSCDAMGRKNQTNATQR